MCLVETVYINILFEKHIIVDIGKYMFYIYFI